MLYVQMCISSTESPFILGGKTKKTRHGKGFQWRMRTVIYSVLLKAKMNLSFTILLNYQKLMGKVEFGFQLDRKSTRLNSSHVRISYAVFCLKKKKSIRRMSALLQSH